MADAARATSAAPTFFDPVRIMKKILVDGGYGNTNNSSEDAWRHYTTVKEIQQTDRVRWVNIGTGTSNDQPLPPRKEWKDVLLPRYIQNIMHTIRDLEKIATDSEKTAVSMHLISNMDRNKLDFHRFSATKGVHAIALDDYQTIDNKELERLTKEYLDDATVESRLRTLARSLAMDYVEKTRVGTPPSQMEDPRLAAESSSIPQLVMKQQPDGLDLLSPGTRVPSMAGASEVTAESSTTSDTSRYHNAVLGSTNPVVGIQVDGTGIGDQFKAPDITATELSPPTRSSTAPA